MPAYRVTIEFSSDGQTLKDAKAKAQKLADWLNSKSPLYNAWIPKMVSDKKWDQEFINGKRMIQ